LLPRAERKTARQPASEGRWPGRSGAAPPASRRRRHADVAPRPRMPQPFVAVQRPLVARASASAQEFAARAPQRS